MTRLLGYPGYPLLVSDVVEARNARLVDATGREIVDLESGVWCASVGHGHPRVLRALVEQASRIAHAGYQYTHPVVENAARELLDLAGFRDGRAVLLCSGSEAVEYAVRAAQAIASRPLLLTMADSYFGAYGSAAARREAEWLVFDWLECAGCPEGRPCDGDCERFASIPFERIGGFLFEPGSSSGLVRFPPAKLVSAIVAAVREGDGLVLVNEVTTGMGRTGRWFGHEHYGMKPDGIALGKGLGNGYPVSAALLSARVVERLGGKPVRYAQSHQNDPLGAAVALEVVRVIREEGLVERGREIGALLLDGLERLRASVPAIREVRCRGLMVAVELDGPATATRVQAGLLERGFLVQQRPGLPLLRVDPPLTIEREAVAGFLVAFEGALASI